MAVTIRSRSCREANSTTIFPLRRPSSTLTLVSNASDSRFARVGETGRRRLLGRGAAGLGSAVAARGHDLLHGPDRQPFGDDPVRQAVLGIRVVEREQGACVAGAQHADRHPALDPGRQVQQPDGSWRCAAGTVPLVRELVMRGAEIIEQLLVGRLPLRAG
jgi:hypothetical protein